MWRRLQRLSLAVMLINFVVSGLVGIDALAHEAAEQVADNNPIHSLHAGFDQNDQADDEHHMPSSDHHKDKDCACCLSASTPALVPGQIVLMFVPILLGVVEPSDQFGEGISTEPLRRPPRAVA